MIIVSNGHLCRLSPVGNVLAVLRPRQYACCALMEESNNCVRTRGRITDGLAVPNDIVLEAALTGFWECPAAASLLISKKSYVFY